jgi:hypothetical protein
MLAGLFDSQSGESRAGPINCRGAASGMMFTDYERILNRDRSDLSAARRESNYSIYSINGGFEGRPRGISELGCLVSTPWTHKSFIDKRRLTSQAGRHGFSG